MKVRLTDEAQRQLRDIHAYLATEATAALADAVIDRITCRAMQIADLPWAGRQVPEYPLEALREVLLRPYRILYRIRPREIEIIAVAHYRQQLPTEASGFVAPIS